MKPIAAALAVTAQVLAIAATSHLLLSPSPADANVEPMMAIDAPPSWMPPTWAEEQREALLVLEDLDRAPLHHKGPRIRSRAAIVADLDTGEVLYGKRQDDALSVASVTKVTAALALASTHPDLSQTLCVSSDQWPTRSGARSKFETGVCHEGWDWVGAALVASDNRGAYGFAGLSGLDYPTFIERMNTVSRELRMHDARWSDPSGLEDENMASARDMLKAITALSTHPQMSIPASAKSWQIQRKQGPYELRTTNKLIRRYETLAAKTGYTDTARYCFATVIRTDSGRRLGAVVLGAPTSSARFADTRKLLTWAEKIDASR